MTTQPTLSNWFSILALGVIWGGTFMVVTIALRGYGPFTVAGARTTLGAASLLILLKATGHKLPMLKGRALSLMVAIGILNSALPFSLLSWGQQYVPSAFAGISMASLPLFVLPLAHIFSDEPLSLRKAIGVLLGFAGATVLIGPGVLQIGSGLEPLGQIACLLAAFSYAVSSILTRNFPPMDPLALATWALIIGSVCLTPVALALEGVPKWAGAEAGFAIVFLGLLPTALAALLRVTVIRTAGSVFMTLVNYQVPLWSMAFGAFVLGEVLTLRFFAALALTLLGLAISQWSSLKKLAQRKTPIE